MYIGVFTSSTACFQDRKLYIQWETMKFHGFQNLSPQNVVCRRVYLHRPLVLSRKSFVAPYKFTFCVHG